MIQINQSNAPDAVMVRQLTPTFGQARARDIAGVANAISIAIGNSAIAEMEDHILLPALAAVLGFSLHNGMEKKMARTEALASGRIGWPSLLDAEEVLAILALTNAPEAAAVNDSRLTEQEYLDRLFNNPFDENDGDGGLIQ